jgi:3-keto-disaccharide hydrolase
MPQQHQRRTNMSPRRTSCLTTALYTKTFTLFVILQSAVVAQEKAAEQNPMALFNGHDLAGWTYHLAKPDVKMEDVWSVKDGILLCKGKPAGYLVTKKNDFENYVLTVEWRWPGKGGNNGVLVHATKPGVLGVWPQSLEVQLQSGDAGDMWVIGTTLEIENPQGRIEGRRHINLTDDSEKPLGEWNTMEITCRSDEITVKVNGQLVNHATKLSQHKGAIALQSEGTPIEYRKVELQKLDK